MNVGINLRKGNGNKDKTRNHWYRRQLREKKS